MDSSHHPNIAAPLELTPDLEKSFLFKFMPFTKGITSSFGKDSSLFESSSILYRTQLLNKYIHTVLKPGQTQGKEKRRKIKFVFCQKNLYCNVVPPEIKDKDMDQNNILKTTAHRRLCIDM